MIHTSLFYTRLSSPIGKLGLFATEKGICGLSFHETGFRNLHKRASRIFNTTPVQSEERFHDLALELERFLKGRSHKISAVLDIDDGLTPFQSQVLKVLQNIPYGAVRSYQWVAQKLGHPKAYRAVGSACAANPVPLLIPCHRVIAKNGSLGGFSSGLITKKWLLDLEKTDL